MGKIFGWLMVIAFYAVALMVSFAVVKWAIEELTR